MGLRPGGSWIDDRYVEIAINGHGQSPGNGGGSHDQNVWRNFIFSPKPSPLLYPEPMLLIDDDKTQIRKFTESSRRAWVPISRFISPVRSPSKIGALRFLDTDPVSSSIRSPNGSTIFFSPS